MYCPICGCPEINLETGLLNIRAFKVETEKASWSHCLLDHSKSNPDYTESDGSIWFGVGDGGEVYLTDGVGLVQVEPCD